MPTRFKYRSVDKDNFGLQPKEIIDADDQDLNDFLSLKKLAPYRTTDRDRVWLDKWRKGGKKRRQELRKKMRADQSEKSAQPESSEIKSDDKKRKKRKHTHKSKSKPEEASKSDVNAKPAASEDRKEGKRKRKRKRADDVEQRTSAIASSSLDKTRLAAYATSKKPKL